MANLVRIKPYSKARGHVLRRYTVYGIRFEEKRGWYKVNDQVASYLKTVHMRTNDPDSPLAFNVCTEEEARRLDLVERKKKIERAEANEPNVTNAYDLTSKEVRHISPPELESEDEMLNEAKPPQVASADEAELSAPVGA